MGSAKNCLPRSAERLQMRWHSLPGGLKLALGVKQFRSGGLPSRPTGDLSLLMKIPDKKGAEAWHLEANKLYVSLLVGFRLRPIC